MDNQQSESKLRVGEGGPLPERRSRTFFKGDGWYFMTRERVDVGPFSTQELAEIGVKDYAGFSMDADHVHPDDELDIVPDESELGLETDEVADLGLGPVDSEVND
jgi:hypothetical protein